MTGKLPPSASVAEPREGGKLFAPAAARNAQAIAEFLRDHAPASGKALEIASGTGQHITHFASSLPGLVWQPTDIEPARLRSIDAHVAEAGVRNVAPAALLDAAQKGWAAKHGEHDLVLVVNLLHLIPTRSVVALLDEAAQAVAPGGCLVIYGPFKRDGVLTSAGDVRFDSELRSADPEIGYKDTAEMRSWLDAAGLIVDVPAEMPANNLIFFARKPQP
ncbi:generic methyltransferase [Sulfitobacter noctilucae]|uniref:DUF938 domain-containing protein n=1 Tax=Sulfitobacter noctilucae TaxID=1342302 RepID=UPI00046A871B|nr:DUF938 domain-containing protein [Sulfitobacter noctilucae]KIN60034.1 generic methyltransferase [Sulfitobacter noctilucae]